MFTLYSYYVETQRRQDEIELANQDRLVRSVTAACDTGLTMLSIRMLDSLGSRLVEWGSQLQCRCAELTYTSTKRAM